MVTILLVRHGQTVANLNKVVMGQGDSPLTPRGREEAQEIGEKLTRFAIDAIYASDLGRARETTEEIVKTAQLTKPVYYVEALREINYGIYNNTKREELRTKCSAYGKELSYLYPRGESVLMAQRRAIQFIYSLERSHLNETILLVSHSGIIRGIINHFQTILLEDYFKKKISNSYIAQFTLHEGRLIRYKELLNL